MAGGGDADVSARGRISIGRVGRSGHELNSLGQKRSCLECAVSVWSSSEKQRADSHDRNNDQDRNSDSYDLLKIAIGGERQTN